MIGSNRRRTAASGAAPAAGTLVRLWFLARFTERSALRLGRYFGDVLLRPLAVGILLVPVVALAVAGALPLGHEIGRTQLTIRLLLSASACGFVTLVAAWRAVFSAAEREALRALLCAPRGDR